MQRGRHFRNGGFTRRFVLPFHQNKLAPGEQISGLGEPACFSCDHLEGSVQGGQMHLIALLHFLAL